MTTYSWDLGFDWNAQPDPSLGANTCYLLHGFVNVDQGTLAAPLNLQNGDTIRFVIYDATSGASTSEVSNYQIAQNSVINFNAADIGQAQTTPFNVSSISIPTGSSNADFTSTFFQIALPSWSNIPSQQISVNSGRYLMSVTVNVTDGTNPTKTFTVDPEMIVGSTN